MMSQSELTPDLTASIGGDDGALGKNAASGMRGWAMYLVLGLTGGILGGIAVQFTHDYFPIITPEGLAGNGIFTAEQLAQLAAARVEADYRNTPLAIGLMGLVVAGFLVLAHGIAQRLPLRQTMFAVLAGAVVGLMVGAAGGYSSVFIRETLQGWSTLDAAGQPDPLRTQIHTMAVQLPSWLAISVAVGAAFWITSGRPLALRALQACCASCLIAALVYPTLASLISATDHPGGVIPSGLVNRLFWGALFAGLMGLAVGKFQQNESQPQTSPSSPVAP